ncbi:MAG: O-antigen polymerase [Bacteroidetes bacterium]|nr:O-antigen polymerase [Bacteroidota bacterium]
MTAAPHITKTQLGLFYILSVLSVVCGLLAFELQMTFLFAVPLLVLVVLFTMLDYKALYFILLFMLPCSIEYYFPNGLATDLPTEPLMVGLMMVTLFLLFYRKTHLPKGFLSNPLVLLLMIHLFWIFICALNSDMPVYSFKVFLAKMWYFVPFTLLTAMMLRGAADIKRMFWCIFIPLVILVVISFLRHGLIYKFDFLEINHSVTPYFRNHVNYAAMMSIFFPFILWAITWYKWGSFKRNVLVVSVAIFIAAVYFSYTRTAMLAILGMIPFYFMIKWRWTKIAVAGFILVATLGISWMFYNNHYLRYAPDFETTIYHDDFSSHLSSTFQGKDVSSMERIYRWVAAARMAHDRPYMGVGSGNFYNYYKSYTVTEFETYISDNEERSTVHNYYLLMLVEQGWIGLGIFLLLTFVVFIYGEAIYYRMDNREDRRAVMILLLVMFSIIINLLLSDMLESDKVGPFFFMVIALLALFDVKAISMKTDGQQG